MVVLVVGIGGELGVVVDSSLSFCYSPKGGSAFMHHRVSDVEASPSYILQCQSLSE